MTGVGLLAGLNVFATIGTESSCLTDLASPTAAPNLSL